MEARTTDTRLVEMVRDSDEEAFGILFERYQPLIFRQILFRTRDADLAHDVVQETFLRIWANRSSLQPHRNFLSYLLTISGNLVRDAAKHIDVRRRLENSVPLPELSERDDPAEALELTMLREEVVAIINGSLPERCRTIFLLSRFEGIPQGEIARLLGLSVRTVEHQINHALKVLRRKLKHRL